MNYIFRIFGLFYLFVFKAFRRALMYCYKPLFKECGNNVVFDPFGIYTFQNIEIGNDVYIGPGAKLLCSETTITLGSKIMFGPNVSILAGDHNTSEIGKFMYDVKNKLPENDLPVIIEDDVWVGTGVIILKGVKIGRGSIVAAGSVVTKSCDNYSIIGGVPSKLLKKRFNPEEVIYHESLLFGK